MGWMTLLDAVDRVLAQSKIAVLATVGPDGYPRMRWMTPAFVRGREGFLYAVTSPQFAKSAEVAGNPRVQWMLQTRRFDEVITLTGTMRVIDNPSVKAEVFEAIGGHLGTFWKLNPDQSQTVVLETAIERVRRLGPQSGTTEEAVAPNG